MIKKVIFFVFLILAVGAFFLIFKDTSQKAGDLVNNSGRNSDVQNNLDASKTLTASGESKEKVTLTSSFSLEEVSQHNNKDDCWMVIEGKVYNVTEFIAAGKHPPEIELGCGKDATKLFNQRTTEEGVKIGSGTPHSQKARNLLQKYYIGDLKM